MMLRVLFPVAACFAVLSCTPPAVRTTPPVPDPVPQPEVSVQPASLPAPTLPPLPPAPTGKRAQILVLGDSQISFGAGGAYTAFFGSLGQNCSALPAAFERADAAAIGVRSTALHHWSSRNGTPRGTICDVDPTYGVNAGAYGVTSSGRSYVQIGQDPAYPFCPAGRAPLEAVFQSARYTPDLIVLSFLGNATARWQDARTARADLSAALAQLPANLPCIVMTTIPAFEGAENDRRARAQANLGAAVRASGQCSFLAGITPATRGAIQGDPRNFRTDDAGGVIDARHPTAHSAARFIKVQTPALCAAVRDALTRTN